MKTNPVLLACSALALALGFVAAPKADAKAAFLSATRGQYKLKTDQTSAKAGCMYCHTTAFGGGSWNAFGQAMRAQFVAAGDNLQVALYNTLKANKDSDGDGYTDVLEVVAKTLPGDAKSKPSKTQAQLQADLKKLGGVAAFQK